MSRKWYPMCDACWIARHPGKPYPKRRPRAEREMCAWCDTSTRSGIWQTMASEPFTLDTPPGVADRGR